MKQIQDSRALWEQLKKILPDLPERCVEMTLKVRFDDAPRLTTICLVGRNQEGEQEKITQTFQLVPVETQVMA